jgi:hypothetical protein
VSTRSRQKKRKIDTRLERFDSEKRGQNVPTIFPQLAISDEDPVAKDISHNRVEARPLEERKKILVNLVQTTRHNFSKPIPCMTDLNIIVKICWITQPWISLNLAAKK